MSLIAVFFVPSRIVVAGGNGYPAMGDCYAASASVGLCQQMSHDQRAGLGICIQLLVASCCWQSLRGVSAHTGMTHTMCGEYGGDDRLHNVFVDEIKQINCRG